MLLLTSRNPPHNQPWPKPMNPLQTPLYSTSIDTPRQRGAGWPARNLAAIPVISWVEPERPLVRQFMLRRVSDFRRTTLTWKPFQLTLYPLPNAGDRTQEDASDLLSCPLPQRGPLFGTSNVQEYQRWMSLCLSRIRLKPRTVNKVKDECLVQP